MKNEENIKFARPIKLSDDAIKLAKITKISEDNPRLIKIYQLLNKLEIDTNDIENVFDLLILIHRLETEIDEKIKYDKTYFIRNYRLFPEIVHTIIKLCEESLNVTWPKKVFTYLKHSMVMLKFRLYRKINKIKNNLSN